MGSSEEQKQNEVTTEVVVEEKATKVKKMVPDKMVSSEVNTALVVESVPTFTYSTSAEVTTTSHANGSSQVSIYWIKTLL